MRIASLVPSATEYLFALGLGDQVVAVTHECGFPPGALELPELTLAVRGETGVGGSLYELDEQLLRDEEPDLIVAQQLCDVCAISFDDVLTVAERLPSRPKVISLDPTTLGEVLGDIRTIAAATGAEQAGAELQRELADRIDDVKIALGAVGRDDHPPRVNVTALESLDPLTVGGHWVPQMIELAGGVDFLGLPGEPSREVSWDELGAAEPEVVVLMQCGHDTARSAEEALAYAGQLRALGARRYLVCDATAYFLRPGPRLVDGLELLAHALHPELVSEPVAGRMLDVDLG